LCGAADSHNTVDLNAPRRIWVRAPNWVGDFVMATPAFERLRRAWPDAWIVGAMRPYLFDLAAGSPWFDAVEATPRAGSVRGLLRQVRAVRSGRYDLAVVLPNSLETGLVPFLAGVPHRLGYRQGRPGLLNHGLRAESARPPWRRHGPRRVPVPMPEYYRRLLDALSVPPGPDATTLHVTDAGREAARTWLAERGIGADARLVLFTAGAAFGASKLWAPERFAEVARRLVAQGVTAVFLAGPAEVELVRGIVERAGANVFGATDPVLPFAALKALVAQSALMVTTDTGPRHIALAFDVPVVCLIGPIDPRYTDYALERQIVIRKPVPCAPCHFKTCPLGHHACMTGIEVEEVVAAAEALLDGA